MTIVCQKKEKSLQSYPKDHSTTLDLLPQHLQLNIHQQRLPQQLLQQQHHHRHHQL